MKKKLLTKVNEFLRRISSEELTEKFQKKLDNFFISLYTYPHDYAVLIYYKISGGCNPVEEYGKKYCGVSKKFYHKSLVRHLCVDGKPLNVLLTKKRSDGRHLYSYCGCFKEKKT